MARINVLDKHLSELIAAGEVVERPSSVAKELIENAVDAGATVVTVEIQNGGISFLRVTDNGGGIAREDVPRAFLRHATSKIATQDDLTAIGTLGFRGEALASICAMARVELLTRTQSELAGTRYLVEGGEEKRLEDAGCPVGTTMVVRDLFYNTPARMKFLKKDVSEGNAVAGVVDKAALSHPEVAFHFVRDGRETLRTPGDGDLKSAVFAVYGREFTEGLIPVDYSLGAMKVDGFVSRPANARPTRAMQNFFINGRFVKSRTAGAAVDEAAKGSVMAGKFLSCVLHLTIPASSVDVNVHPAKIEVRFVTERPVFDAVYHAVKSSLARDDRPGSLRLPQGKASPPRVPAPEGKARVSDGAAGGYLAEQTVLRQYLPGPGDPQPAVRALKREERADDDYVVETPPLRPFDRPEKRSFEGERPMTVPVAAPVMPPKEEAAPAQPEDADALRPGRLPETDAPPETLPPPRQELRFIGEAFGTYILLETDCELIFIDKHAAHERILYEKLKQENGERYAQQLLAPVPVTLDKESCSALLEERGLLSKAGFELEDFGAGTLLVRSAPLSFGEQDIAGSLAEIAEHLLEHRRDISTKHDDWILHNVACRAAIKAGDQNSREELLALARQLHEDPTIRYCPHGRPVYLSMKKRELEKQFGRLG